MNKQWRMVFVLLTVSVIAAAGLRMWLYPALHLQAAQLLPSPKSVEGYGLTIGGARVDVDMAKGRWVLVFFGYTSCPDICPLELQKLAQMLNQFDASDVKHKPIVVFISVDPERDTLDVLKNYTSYFHPEIQGFSGTNSELAALAQFFGASYNRTTTMNGKEYVIEAGADMPVEAERHYMVNHSSRIFIIDPESHYIGSFAPPHDAGILFTDMQQLIRN